MQALIDRMAEGVVADAVIPYGQISLTGGPFRSAIREV
jgi:hypothetical protein